MGKRLLWASSRTHRKCWEFSGVKEKKKITECSVSIYWGWELRLEMPVVKTWAWPQYNSVVVFLSANWPYETRSDMLRLRLVSAALSVELSYFFASSSGFFPIHRNYCRIPQLPFWSQAKIISFLSGLSSLSSLFLYPLQHLQPKQDSLVIKTYQTWKALEKKTFYIIFDLSHTWIFQFLCDNKI